MGGMVAATLHAQVTISTPTTPVEPPAPRPRGGVLRGLVAAARPRQWVKNVLVFAAPAAAAVLGHGDVLARTLETFVAFCLVSSATYMLNDVVDVEADRMHPVKRHRPVAGGLVSIPVALAAAAVLLACGVALSFAVSWKLGLLVAGYKVLTTAYTFRLKHTANVDIVIVASGFMVRAVAGGVAVGVPLSHWFLAVTSFGSLFIVAGKRQGELLRGGDSATCPVLAEYTLEHLRFVVTTSAAVTIVTYCLWAFGHPRTSSIPWWGLSIVPFVMGIMRYALLVDRGEGGTPEELIIRDPGLRLVGLAWLALFLGSVYVH
jgi:decaprenyl-phosphate phosphoribosyltransferase